MLRDAKRILLLQQSSMKACSLISLPHRKSVNTKRDSRNYTYRDCIVFTRFYFTCCDFFRRGKASGGESICISSSRDCGEVRSQTVRRCSKAADLCGSWGEALIQILPPRFCRLRAQAAGFVDSFYIDPHRSTSFYCSTCRWWHSRYLCDAFWGGVGFELRNCIFRAMPCYACLALSLSSSQFVVMGSQPAEWRHSQHLYAKQGWGGRLLVRHSENIFAQRLESPFLFDGHLARLQITFALRWLPARGLTSPDQSRWVECAGHPNRQRSAIMCVVHHAA